MFQCGARKMYANAKFTYYAVFCISLSLSSLFPSSLTHPPSVSPYSLSLLPPSSSSPVSLQRPVICMQMSPKKGSWLTSLISLRMRGSAERHISKRAGIQSQGCMYVLPTLCTSTSTNMHPPILMVEESADAHTVCIRFVSGL